jgi:curved DNA-binding protein CbpA
VAQTASGEDIKSAFNEKVKQTHPDADGTGSQAQTREFRDLVEAYKILRDEKKRRQYDLERANRGNFAQGGPNASARRGPGGDPDMAAPLPRNPAEGAALGAVILGGLAIFLTSLSREKPYKDTEYPRKLPQRAALLQADKKNLVADAPQVYPQPSMKMSGAMESGSQAHDEMVRAFFDPFFSMWYRIPEGYEAPSGMDLTAWHNKRTDPVEWSRMHADGKLSQIIPRGGLQVRFLPAWETHPAIMVLDPSTGKTVNAQKLMPPRSKTQKCTVQF